MIYWYLSPGNKPTRSQERQKVGKPKAQKEFPNVIVLHNKLYGIIQLLQQPEPHVEIKQEGEKKGMIFLKYLFGHNYETNTISLLS